MNEADSINAYAKILERFGIRSIVAVIHEGTSQTRYEGPTDPTKPPPAGGSIVDIVKALDDEVDVVVSAHAHGFTNAFVEREYGTPVSPYPERSGQAHRPAR